MAKHIESIQNATLGELRELLKNYDDSTKISFKMWNSELMSNVALLESEYGNKIILEASER